VRRHNQTRFVISIPLPRRGASPANRELFRNAYDRITVYEKNPSGGFLSAVGVRASGLNEFCHRRLFFWPFRRPGSLVGKKSPCKLKLVRIFLAVTLKLICTQFFWILHSKLKSFISKLRRDWLHHNEQKRRSVKSYSTPATPFHPRLTACI